MNESPKIPIARNGVVIHQISHEDIPEALSKGEISPSDYFFDQESGSWRAISESAWATSCVGNTSPKADMPQKSSMQAVALVAVALVLALVVFVVPKPTSALNQGLSVVDQMKEATERARRAEERVAALMPRFLVRTDKFENISWFTHVDSASLRSRLFSSKPSALLEVEVNSRGGRYLVSNYFAERALRYDFVIFLVDGVKNEGTRGPSREDKSVENIDQGTYERCVHTWSEDRKIVSQLAEAYKAGKSVSARLENLSDNKVYDWDLSQDELRVIAESLELADALRDRWLAEAELSSLRSGGK